MVNLLRKIFDANGARVPGPVAVPAINQERYDPGFIHPIKNGFGGFARF